MLFDGEMFEQPHLLRHHSDKFLDAPRPCKGIDADDFNRARRWPQFGCDLANERCFAASVRAEKRQQFTSFNSEAYFAVGEHATSISFADALYGDGRRVHRFTPAPAKSALTVTNSYR